MQLTPFILRLRLVGAAVLFAMLAASAIWFGRFALEYGIDTIAVIAEFGVEEGIDILGQDLQDLVLFGGGGPLWLAGAVVLYLCISVYVATWLRLASVGFVWLSSGIWAFQAEEDHGEVPTELPEPERLHNRFTTMPEPVKSTPGIRLLLGPGVAYLPEMLQRIIEPLVSPINRAAGQVLKTAFFAALTLVVLAGVSRSADVAFAIPDLLAQVAVIAKNLAAPLMIWMLAAIAVEAVNALLNLQFARSIAKHPRPKAAAHETSLGNLSYNGSAETLYQTLGAELRSLGGQIFRVQHIAHADVTRLNTANQNEFDIRLLIEGPSRIEPAPMNGAARFRAATGMAFQLGYALIMLFLVFPQPFIGLIAGQPIAAAAIPYAFVHLVLAWTLAARCAQIGRKSLQQAENIEAATRFHSPVVLLHLRGESGTQTANTGKGIHDSTGIVLNLRQSQFRAFCQSSTLDCLAPAMAGRRSITSCAPDLDSQSLEDLVTHRLRHIFSETLVGAAALTIQDTHAILRAPNSESLDYVGPVAQIT